MRGSFQKLRHADDDDGEQDERMVDIDQSFMPGQQPAMVAQPGEGALDDPAVPTPR